MKLPVMRQGAESFKPWNIVESFSEPKDKMRGNEDAFVRTSHCVAILDGVSSAVSSERIDGMTAGQLAVHAAVEVLKKDTSVSSETIVERLSEIVQSVRTAKNTINTPSFVFIAFFPEENVIVRVGDCSYLIDSEGANPEIAPDKARAVLRRREIERKLNTGESVDSLLANDPMITKAQSLRAWQDHFGNNDAAQDFGYGVIDGSSVPERFVEYIPVPVTARSVILASDGYPPQILASTLMQTENELKKLQAADPLGIQSGSIRALKPTRDGQTATDDRTYLRLERS